MNLQVEELFVTPIWHSFLPDRDSVNAELMTSIEWAESNLNSTHKSNEGGWHSPDNMHYFGEFNVIVDAVHAMADNIKQSLRIDDTRRFSLDAMWINVNKKHDYNAIHEHPNAHLSGVYYVKVNEHSGDLRFRDPRAVKRMNSWPSEIQNIRFMDRVNYKPEVGKMVMFPSWLEHDVMKNLSEESRISISFNLTLQ